LNNSKRDDRVPRSLQPRWNEVSLETHFRENLTSETRLLNSWRLLKLGNQR